MTTVRCNVDSGVSAQLLWGSTKRGSDVIGGHCLKVKKNIRRCRQKWCWWGMSRRQWNTSYLVVEIMVELVGTYVVGRRDKATTH